MKLLEPEINRKMREHLREISLKLGAPGGSQRAADLIVQFICLNPRP
jgi:hypothetical protein